jgi:hypothetical protein
VRFHCVLAPHSAWRKKVVPAKERSTPGCRFDGASIEVARAEDVRVEPHIAKSPNRRTGRVAMQSAPPDATTTSPTSAVMSAPGEPRFGFARIDWAALLKRVYDVDALACSCGGRLRFISLILEAEVARHILESLGLPSEPPPIARARSPDPRDAEPAEW